jgi:predicted O-linked N-acetylglucosamine transferase (SPINDLY family)
MIAIEPDNADALSNRGFVLNALGRREEALKSCEQALRIDPRHVDALNNRGVTLADLGRFEDAIGSYDQVLELADNHIGAHCNGAKALHALNRFHAALTSAERALAIEPGSAEALVARGDALVRLERTPEAIACFEQVLALAPEHPLAAASLAFSCLSICEWDKLAHAERELMNAVTRDSAIVSPHVLLALSVNAADALRCTRRFVEHAVPMGSKLPPLTAAKAPAPREKIRLAYLSGDFRRHPVGYLVPELIERHDRSRFEVIGVSYGPDDGSELRARIARAFDQFHDVRARSDRDVAVLVRELGVDIAIDLSGHTDNARTGILAVRPAPVQVSYLGLLGTMGADFIDYVLADKLVLPFDQQPFYPEKIVHLPDCFMVADSRTAMSPRRPTRSEVGLPAHGFVFASFNSTYKLRREVFAVWMRLLRAIDGSVLWLLAGNESTAANLTLEARRHDVDPTRLVFARPIAHSEHLARQGLADLFLDTSPYNAGATAMAALWSGLPVLTIEGEGFVGRMAASILHSAGLPELVTHGLADYEALAQKLARDPALLGAIRTKLEHNRATHPLFDVERFRRHIEAAYTTMWEVSRRGEVPQSFSVRPIEPGKP